MIIVEIKERKDGSALVTFDMTKKEQKLLIERGFIGLLEDKIEEDKKRKGRTK